MTEILGVGVAVVDIINFTHSYPGSDDEVRAIAQQKRRGGNVANTLSVLRQFSHHCRWLGALADDDGANFIRQDLEAQGIVLEDAGCMHGVTPTSYIIAAKDSGSRSIVHYRQLDELSFEQFRRVNFEQIEYCHFEARNVQETAKMLDYLHHHRPHLRYSLEIEKPRENLDLLGEHADLIFYSRHYANSLGYDNAIDFLQSITAKSPHTGLICSWGEQGCYYRQGATGSTLEHAEAEPVSRVMDSIGAGDTFIAGFLHQWWRSHDLRASAEFANILAAKKCEQIGFEGLSKKVSRQ